MRINRKSISFAVLFAMYCTSVWCQAKVNLAPNIELTFPQPPEIFDTLGQKVFNYSDEVGYYACIIRRNAVPADKAPMDLKSFYANLYKSLQRPEEECRLIKQTDLVLAGIIGAEFQTMCKEDPEFPEIRYKRLILYANTLYVLDYWTTKAHIGQAEQNKSKFLNSFVLHAGGDVAIIPPAISPSSHKNTGTDRWIPWSILGGTIVLMLGLIFLVRKQKKSLKQTRK